MPRAHLGSQGTVIPDPSRNYMLCNSSGIPVNEAIKTIACAAERNSIYVVVNLLEKEVCSGNACPSDGMFLYLTSVTFDREGRIIARYRSSHLLSEYGVLDSTRSPELSTFDTDFGVTFGNIICFDIMYEEPWLTLTRKHNITDIIYSSGWSSQLPFLTTVQIEAGWAYTEDVNILASGNSNIESGNSGSGIYAGRQGVLTAILPLDNHEEMLIADVWKKSKNNMATSMLNRPQEHPLQPKNEAAEYHADNKHSQKHDSHNFKWIYDKLDTFKTKVIANDGMIVQKINHHGLKCRFEVNVTNLSPPVTYRLLALDGSRSFVIGMTLGTRVCAIVQCADETLDSCGHIRNSSAIFNFMTITAMYVDNRRTVMMPNTLGADMLPLKKWTFREFRYKTEISKTISLTSSTKNVVTFGIWGRNFETDKTSSASRISYQFLYFPLLLVISTNVF